MVNFRRPSLAVTAGALLIGAALLAGCAPDTSAPALNTEQRSERLALTQQGPPPTPIELPSQVEILARSTPNATDAICLDCHSNEELLRELAVEEEEDAEALSSGPG